ncbi:hypothetical protein M408DRAFT_333181 [Serendipita vermifera MAFF 305830]|uniref:FAD dependent oxidoreductase domain-containing protein n=1 Tax=Serendipita vermifera MAFF 305830 TaxID=933852 RepID=A0A0C3APC2_SERVB|nr:hypothetical protein M408DRAFT_333181 [Serendipita vermifera MAFF 305830]
MQNLKSSAIVVVGAGVTGLTTALVLRREGYENITIVAKHMPGDRALEYTSPWAAVNYAPVSEKGTAAEEWDRLSWAEFWRLAHESPEAGIHIQKKISYCLTDSGKDKDVWFKDLTPNYRFLDESELPPGVKWGKECDTFCIDPAIYLPYLKIRCISQGIQFKRVNLSHIKEAFSLHGNTSGLASVVINCTGVLASKLGGVEDDSVVPVKGQLVLVRNKCSGMFGMWGAKDWPAGESCYVMNRPFGGGTVLGGSSHQTWDPTVDMDLAKRIMQRAIEACPELVKPGEGIEGLDVIHHSVGFRPVRKGGPRIEVEELPGNLKIVHNYGAGGFGYQSSWGMASAAVQKVNMAIRGSSEASTLL